MEGDCLEFSREAIILVVIGIIVLAGLFSFAFNGLNAPVHAIVSMIVDLVFGAIIGIALLFLLIGLLLIGTG